MADISKINVSPYIGKTSDSELPASDWNTYVSLVGAKINELVDASNGASPVPSSGKFYVNGTETTATSGVVTLDAFGGTNYPTGGYVLTGYLAGQVVIGTSSDSPSDDTQIILDGATIVTDSTDNAAIMYAPSAQSVKVTLGKNSVNYLICSNVAAKADSQKGCLWSENNMVLQGNGYLACQNNGGHGIKASELRIYGNPHIYVDAIHDGIHGNAQLDVIGGVYYIKNANDAFGTRLAEGTVGADDYKAPGVINVYKASIEAYSIGQNVLDSKGAGNIYGDLSINTDVAAANVFSGMTYVDPLVKFGGATQNTTDGGYSMPENGTGTVKCYSDEDMTTGETTITASDGTYTLTTAYAKISGYVEGNITTSVQSSNLTLDNAYVIGNISYTASKKKFQVNVEKDTIGMVVGNIASSSNIAAEVKSGGVFKIDGNFSGDELTLNDSKGVMIFNGNVTGKEIYIASDKDASTKGLHGAVIINGILKAVLNSKFTKGWVHVTSSQLSGIVYADTIDAIGYADLNNSSRVFYHNAKGVVVGAKTIENDEYVAI